VSTLPPPWLAVAPPVPDDAIPLGGRDWNRVRVVRDTDGDTVRILRERITARLVEDEESGDHGRRQRWQVDVDMDDVEEVPGGLAGRLISLDTPELHSKDPDERAHAREAADDMTMFVRLNAGRLRCVTYDQGGGFDRLLIDLYVLDDDGTRHTASEWMLGRGWLPYVRGQ
jgi:endonuclease YncB( thermonuclease family)